MNDRQKRFAHEYVVDHNGAAAARRAGYSPKRAKQTAASLLKRPDVTQLIEQLDAEKRDELGVTARWWIEQAKLGLEMCQTGAPKTNRNGELVRGPDGEIIREWPAMAHAKHLELIGKAAGLFVERSEVETTGEVVYTLRLDRDLAVEDDDED